jgi:hypothetical protein
MIADLDVTGNGFNRAGLRVGPKRMRTTLALEVAPVSPQVRQNSPHDNGFTDSVRGNRAESVRTAVLKDQSDGFRKALFRFFLGPALAIGSGDFGAVCDVPIAIALDNGSKLVVHTYSSFRLQG